MNREELRNDEPMVSSDGKAVTLPGTDANTVDGLSNDAESRGVGKRIIDSSSSSSSLTYKKFDEHFLLVGLSFFLARVISSFWL